MSEIKVNKISPRTNCGTVTVGDAGDSVTVSAGVPVTVNGDLKSNALKAVDGGSIISQCGTSITLGASGDTINLAAGASQTGFGRTGTVDWDTTAKTASFTAVSGNGYFVNTTSGAITVTLPATPSAGDIVSIADYAGTAATNNITIARNGSNFEGGAADGEITTNRQSITLVYVDGTQGWVPTSENDSSFQQALFTVATGGTITTSGDYKIHTFTGPGTFCVSQIGNGPTNPIGGPNAVDYLVVAGGGGGARGYGAGGGGGGYRESHSTPVSGCYSASPLATPTGITVSATPYSVTVGAGGASSAGAGNPGSNSVFSTITSTGGGGGGNAGSGVGGSGGSGGGGGGNGGGPGPIPGTAGAGNTPPVSPPQGSNGGLGFAIPVSAAGAAGGGATGTGGNASNGLGGTGGTGTTTSISASPLAYSGGGGGGVTSPSTGGSGSSCGTGGTGGGNSAGSAGTTNRGGGGGGGGGDCVGGIPTRDGNSGGSGIVIIRYKFQ
jgi:hypothetical protein